MRDRQGVMGYAHLVLSITPNGGAQTVCGKMGTKISNVGVTKMIRCPECELGSQLL